MTALLVLLTGLVCTTPRLLSLLLGCRTARAQKWVGLAAAVLVGLLGAWVGLGPLHLQPSPLLLLVLLYPAVWILWGLRVARAEPGPRARAVLWRATTLVLLVAVLALTQAAASSPAQSACAVAGVVLLLTDPANDVVAALLYTVRPAAWWHGGRQPVAREGLLGGGRWIGTLERLLVLLLAFSTAAAAIAAVVAAKGVIRFPEISADAPRPSRDQPQGGERGLVGAKAEEFLIGSFASWGLALLAYLLLAALGLRAPGGGGSL